MTSTKRNILIAVLILAAIAAVAVVVTLAIQKDRAPADNGEPVLNNTSSTTEDTPTEEAEHAVTIVTNAPVNSDTVVETEQAEPIEVYTDEADVPAADTPELPDEPAQTTAATTTKKPVITTATNAPEVTAPPSTVRTDLPVVTSTTKATTTTAATEPEEDIEYDENGFPANPEYRDIFIDDNGQKWEYVYPEGIWLETGPAILYEFPDNYEPIGSGEQILH